MNKLVYWILFLVCVFGPHIHKSTLIIWYKNVKILLQGHKRYPKFKWLDNQSPSRKSGQTHWKVETRFPTCNDENVGRVYLFKNICPDIRTDRTWAWGTAPNISTLSWRENFSLISSRRTRFGPSPPTIKRTWQVQSHWSTKYNQLTKSKTVHTTRK